jgi:type IX secretion system PorP/SprF family membrane protein
MCNCNFLIAQDIHFSQLYNSPINLNPANTGFFDGDYRFVGNFKNQWNTVPVPYNSSSLTADSRIKIKSKKIGIGILLNQDQSGDSRFKTFNSALNFSYQTPITKDSSQFISVGIQTGITSKSVNYNYLSFNNQYNGDTYNANAPTGENFQSNRIIYPDLGMGLNYQLLLNKLSSVTLSGSLLHINSPKQSLFKDNQTRLDKKYILSISGQFRIIPKVDLLPFIAYSKQGKFNETLLGTRIRYLFPSVNGYSSAFYLGFYSRVKDAIIFTVGMDYYNFHVSISYDVTTSNFKTANNMRGGPEFSVIYIFKKLIPFVAKKRMCPVYM